MILSVNTPQRKGVGAGQASDLKWIEKSTREVAKFANQKPLLLRKVHCLLKLLKL